MRLFLLFFEIADKMMQVEAIFPFFIFLGLAGLLFDFGVDG
jgi:hypothetical protein